MWWAPEPCSKPTASRALMSIPQVWALWCYFGFQKAIFAKIGLGRKRLLFM